MAEEIESKRGISDKWITNNVYEALERIEECERRMWNGCSDLMTYIQQIGIGLQYIPEIQLHNMKIMMVEFSILIENVKGILKKPQYEIANYTLSLCNEKFTKGMKNKEGKQIPVYKIIKDNATYGKKRRAFILNTTFYIIANILTDLRSKLVGNLSHILYIPKDLGTHKKEI